jgi:hypothetical protein
MRFILQREVRVDPPGTSERRSTFRDLTEPSVSGEKINLEEARMPGHFNAGKPVRSSSSQIAIGRYETG